MYMVKRDVVIIGSGLAGTLICNELTQYANVTLLEAGPENGIEYPGTNFINKDFGVVKTFCCGGGGTTNLWHNGLIPIDLADIHNGSIKDMLSDANQFIDKAANRLFFRGQSYLAEYQTIRNRMNQLVESIGIFSEGVDCLIYPKHFSKLIPDARVSAFYNVTDISFKADPQKVTAINFKAEGKIHSIVPDAVVVAAGALGTPQIVRKILKAADCQCDNIGIGLADHPMGFIGKVKIKRNLNSGFKRLSTLDKGDYVIRTAVRLKSDCGQYTCGVFFRPALTMQNDLSIYKYKSRLGASSGAERLKSAFSLKLFHPDILAEIYSHLFNVQIQSRTYNVLILFEQKRGNNRVQNSGDRHVSVDWSISDNELVVYNELVSKLKTMLSEIADELVLKMPLSEEWLWSAAHHSGTISLGDNIDDIVDTDLRLKISKNVFICDGSIIQEHSYANTGLTIGQLALRLADRLKNNMLA